MTPDDAATDERQVRAWLAYITARNRQSIHWNTIPDRVPDSWITDSPPAPRYPPR